MGERLNWGKGVLKREGLTSKGGSLFWVGQRGGWGGGEG